MRGISEKFLMAMKPAEADFYDEADRVINFLLEECQELNPWQPIESAPKDRPIFAVVDGKTRIVRWGKTSHIPMYGFCLADQGCEDFDICSPSAWQELPEPPK